MQVDSTNPLLVVTVPKVSQLAGIAVKLISCNSISFIIRFFSSYAVTYPPIERPSLTPVSNKSFMSGVYFLVIRNLIFNCLSSTVASFIAPITSSKPYQWSPWMFSSSACSDIDSIAELETISSWRSREVVEATPSRRILSSLSSLL